MGETKKALEADNDVLCRTHIGGQALIEGIMMRGRYNWAVAIREPDGNIYTEVHDLASGRKKNSWLRWPVIRGCTAFIESLALGYKALDIASEHAYDFDEETDEEREAREAKEAKKAAKRVKKAGISVEELLAREAAETAEAAADTAEATSEEQPAEEDQEQSKGLGALMGVSMVIGIVIGVALFMLLPAWLSNLILGKEAMNGAAWNILDGIIRVAIFILYIWLISKMKDIHRMFEYHGAEHKTIHCFEHGLELTPENAQSFPTLHVRCGTAFIIMVMIIAIFVYTVLSGPINALVGLSGFAKGTPVFFILAMIVRIILLPLIAGLSYEITVRWAGTRPDNPLVRVVLWPGMQMQRLTTKPPDDSMVECAIEAMKLVIAREELEAAKEEEQE